MSFPRAEEITKVTVPAAAMREQRLTLVVDEHLNAHKKMIEDAAMRGEFRLVLNPPSKSIIENYLSLGESESNFNVALGRRLRELGYETISKGYLDNTDMVFTIYWLQNKQENNNK